MAKEAKLWGGLKGGRERVIVKATSAKRARELLALVGMYVSAYEFGGYWALTGNANELFRSSGMREGVWIAESSMPRHAVEYRWLTNGLKT